MIFDWIIILWMSITIILTMTIISLQINLVRRFLKFERKIDSIDEKLFQLALSIRLPISMQPPITKEIEQKKRGWPKGKTRKFNGSNKPEDQDSNK